MESIWHQTSAAAPRPPLEEDLSAEAAVIGGGMAGILTAALLEEAGVRTVVLEADRVGSGQTGNTTAKVTSQHGDCYRRLEERLGAEAAVQYAGAGQEAVEASASSSAAGGWTAPGRSCPPISMPCPPAAPWRRRPPPSSGRACRSG